MTQPLGDVPALPLAREAELTVRQMRVTAAGLARHTDRLVRADAQVLNSLADALERSLGHTDGIQR